MLKKTRLIILIALLFNGIISMSAKEDFRNIKLETVKNKIKDNLKLDDKTKDYISKIASELKMDKNQLLNIVVSEYNKKKLDSKLKLEDVVKSLYKKVIEEKKSLSQSLQEVLTV